MRHWNDVIKGRVLEDPAFSFHKEGRFSIAQYFMVKGADHALLFFLSSSSLTAIPSFIIV